MLLQYIRVFRKCLANTFTAFYRLDLGRKYSCWLAIVSVIFFLFSFNFARCLFTVLPIHIRVSLLLLSTMGVCPDSQSSGRNWVVSSRRRTYCRTSTWPTRALPVETSTRTLSLCDSLLTTATRCYWLSHSQRTWDFMVSRKENTVLIIYVW